MAAHSLALSPRLLDGRRERERSQPTDHLGASASDPRPGLRSSPRRPALGGCTAAISAPARMAPVAALGIPRAPSRQDRLVRLVYICMCTDGLVAICVHAKKHAVAVESDSLEQCRLRLLRVVCCTDICVCRYLCIVQTLSPSRRPLGMLASQNTTYDARQERMAWNAHITAHSNATYLVERKLVLVIPTTLSIFFFFFFLPLLRHRPSTAPPPPLLSLLSRTRATSGSTTPRPEPGAVRQHQSQ